MVTKTSQGRHRNYFDLSEYAPEHLNDPVMTNLSGLSPELSSGQVRSGGMRTRLLNLGTHFPRVLADTLIKLFKMSHPRAPHAPSSNRPSFPD